MCFLRYPVLIQPQLDHQTKEKLRRPQFYLPILPLEGTSVSDYENLFDKHLMVDGQEYLSFIGQLDTRQLGIGAIILAPDDSLQSMVAAAVAIAYAHSRHGHVEKFWDLAPLLGNPHEYKVVSGDAAYSFRRLGAWLYLLELIGRNHEEVLDALFGHTVPETEWLIPFMVQRYRGLVEEGVAGTIRAAYSKDRRVMTIARTGMPPESDWLYGFSKAPAVLIYQHDEGTNTWKYYFRAFHPDLFPPFGTFATELDQEGEVLWIKIGTYYMTEPGIKTPPDRTAEIISCNFLPPELKVEFLSP